MKLSPVQRWLLTACVTIGVALVATRPASSHLSNFTTGSGAPAPDKWGSTPVWHLNPARNANIQGTRDLGEVMQTSFATWSAAPGSAADAIRTGDSSSTSTGFNSENLVCFICQGDFTEEPETLAVTITTTATQTGASDGRGGTTQFVGQILDSDILFNPERNFHTSGGPGEDVQTVAIHEIGHFFGMNHSPVVRAVMFPFSPANQRLLSYDDVAGVATKYPDGSQATGVISGAIRLGGSAIFGAHVFAESQTGADPWGGVNIRKSPISTLSRPDGSYRIEGLPPDAYGVSAEPVDLPAVNDDVDDFGKAFGGRSVQTNFTTRWY
jgi:hypothetical protein